MNDERRSVVRRAVMPNNSGTPLVTPLTPSVMYHYESASQMQAVSNGDIEGFKYARDGHPNAVVLAEKLSWMEGAAAGLMTSSGMTAISAAFLALLHKGDCVAASSQLYGRSHRMIQHELPRLGFETRTFDPTDRATFADAIRPGTRLVLTEIISNPMLRVVDFEPLVAATHAAGALLLVDNTVSTPSLFKPLADGADLVMHSVTKMLSGHSDLNLGYIGSKDTTLLASIDELAATMGLNSSPYNCWLAERGLNTFDLRLQRALSNADQLARLLQAHPMVSTVHYPGLDEHVDHDRAKELLAGGFGTVVSFVLAGDRTQADTFLKAAQNIPYGPTLGDVATIVIMPALSSHRKLQREERLAIGIEDNLVRVSLGIEDFNTIEADFTEALDAAGASEPTVSSASSQ